MSSFFTLPASQKKRKRSQVSAPAKSDSRREERKDDESISGSDVSEEDATANGDDFSEDDEDEEFPDEDPSAKRIRLAEQYLVNKQAEVLEDVGFDAAEVDQENLRRRMGEKLKEDTAETRGKLYRRIADGLDWQGAERKLSKRDGIQKSATGIAIHHNYVYVVSKDLQLVKLEIPDGAKSAGGRQCTNMKVVARARGGKKIGESAQHHTQAILCVSVSPDGKFVATGGADKKLIVWHAERLKPLKVFTQHRDAVTSLAFRRGSNQLFSASRDRTVKTWSLDELAYVETLFGHQDEVVDVDALARETCVTVGCRDRTARFWKVVEESQLLFRGGGAPGTAKALAVLRNAYGEDTVRDDGLYHEGSMDRIAMIDDETFVTGSDNGSLSLWSINKKKAVFTLPLAHGLDPALPVGKASAELDPDEDLDERGRGGKQPRWITALKAMPYSDVFVTGSWDGFIRAWKISQDKRRIEPCGAIAALLDSLDTLLDNEGLSSDSLTSGALQAMKAGIDAHGPISGIVNDLAIVDSDEKGKLLIAAAFGKEHRLGRWKTVSGGRNGVVLYRVSPKVAEKFEDEAMDEDTEFAGFD